MTKFLGSSYLHTEPPDMVRSQELPGRRDSLGATGDQRAASQATGRSQMLTEASAGQAVLGKAVMITLFLPG